MEEKVPVGRIRVRTAQTVATRVAAHALGFVVSILIARALGPVGRGAYYLPVTVSAIAYYAGNLGTEQAQFRLWSRRDLDRGEFVTSSWFFAGTLGALAVGTTWIAYLSLTDSLLADVSAANLLLALAVVPIQIHALLVSGLLLLDGRLGRVNIAALVGAATQTALATVLYIGGWLTVWRVLLLYVLSVTVPWLLMLPRLRMIGQLSWPPSWRFIWQQLSIGLRLQPYILAQYLNLRLDVFLVAGMMDLRSVGLYSVALVFGELIWLFTSALSTAVSEHQGAGSDTLVLDVTLRAARMGMLASSLGGAIVGALAFLLIPQFYGPEFAGASAVVWPLMVAGVGMTLWRSIAPVMIRYASPSLPSAVASAGLAINIAGNVILIPRFGIIGAGIASAVSYWSGGLMCCWWMRCRYRSTVRQLLPGSAEVKTLAQLLGGMARWTSVGARESA